MNHIFDSSALKHDTIPVKKTIVQLVCTNQDTDISQLNCAPRTNWPLLTCQLLARELFNYVRLASQW